MDLEYEIENFKAELATLESEPVDIILRANKIISRSRLFLNNLYKFIIDYNFKTKEDEIKFFKRIKQVPQVPLVLFSEIRSFEMQYPRANETSKKNYCQKKLASIDRFFEKNIEFIQYIELNQTHYDEQYFTRTHIEECIIMSSEFYFMLPEFSTPRDFILSKLSAYNRLLKYVTSKSTQFQLTPRFSPLQAGDKPVLQWTSSKTALTELIYALYHSHAINNGKAEIKDIAHALQKVLDYNIGDFYKTYGEIKTRKKSRTKFLDELSTNLLIEMDKAEE